MKWVPGLVTNPVLKNSNRKQLAFKILPERSASLSPKKPISRLASREIKILSQPKSILSTLRGYFCILNDQQEERDVIENKPEPSQSLHWCFSRKSLCCCCKEVAHFCLRCANTNDPVGAFPNHKTGKMQLHICPGLIKRQLLSCITKSAWLAMSLQNVLKKKESHPLRSVPL